MKRLLFLIQIFFVLCSSTNAQDVVKPNYDSLWYFYPFSIDLSAGLWTPVGKLSKYYNPSAQFGASFGLMVSKRMRFQLWIMPRLLNQKKSILVNVNDSIVDFDKNIVGASLGGWLSYTYHQNKNFSNEIMTGATWESIPTNIIKPGKEDSITISSVGLSLGVNSWINIFPRQSFALRTIYTYATYNKSKYLASTIGGHSVTFSLVYRVQRRSKENKRWY